MRSIEVEWPGGPSETSESVKVGAGPGRWTDWLGDGRGPASRVRSRCRFVIHWGLRAGAISRGGWWCGRDLRRSSRCGGPTVSPTLARATRWGSESQRATTSRSHRSSCIMRSSGEIHRKARPRPGTSPFRSRGMGSRSARGEAVTRALAARIEAGRLAIVSRAGGG